MFKGMHVNNINKMDYIVANLTKKGPFEIDCVIKIRTR